MSNQSISPSEFQRFQDQLISLKEEKYKSEEKCEFLMRNLSHLELKCSQLERELVKANDLKNKFRSAKDMDILMNENQLLRDRLSTIEINFKLQNDIIRTECENLFSENERLKSQMETYKSNQNKSDVNINNIDQKDMMDSPKHQDQQYKVRYLQHEVTKLLEEKKAIENENQILKDDVIKIKQLEQELISRINCLLNEKTKLINQCHVLSEQLEITNTSHSSEIEITTLKYEERLELLTNEYEDKLLKLKTKMEEESLKRQNESLISFQHESDQLQSLFNEKEIKLTTIIDKITIDNDNLKKDNESKILELKGYYEVGLHEKLLEIERLENSYKSQIKELENTNGQLQSELDYTVEELKVLKRKSHKSLKDVKKQLEKEVKLTQDTQSRLEEAVSSGSQNSQTKINEYLGGMNYKMASADDQSSLYSSSNNGLILEAQQSISNSIAVTDDELKNLLDKLTSVQNDFCESKRYIDALKNDKGELMKTIERQQNIILNYIKNRGGNGNDSDNLLHSPKHNHSTSEALILNDIMSSGQTSNFGLLSLVNKVKDSLKSISSSDQMPFGDKSVCRVTTAEVKQLQRVCEELMMRCLNLETDLQLALDLNMQLNAQLSAV